MGAGLSGWAFWRRWLGQAVRLPPQWQDRKLDELPLLAVDLELTSLDAKIARITSIGWVAGQGGSIAMDSAYYEVLRVKGDLQQSPVIHGLTSEHIAQGSHLRDSLSLLANYAHSHIWVFHNANLDVQVLNQAFAANNQWLGQVVTLDTLKLAVYQLNKQHEVLPPDSATLTVCRQRLDLPASPAHNALDDALSTLQLWFAQYHQLNGQNSVSIGDFLHTQCINVVNLGKKCESVIDKPR